jgi:hypothetical protein
LADSGVSLVSETVDVIKVAVIPKGSWEALGRSRSCSARMRR